MKPFQMTREEWLRDRSRVRHGRAQRRTGDVFPSPRGNDQKGPWRLRAQVAHPLCVVGRAGRASPCFERLP